MARALATLPADAGDGDIIDLSEPYDAALHAAAPPPATPAAHVRQPNKCGPWVSHERPLAVLCKVLGCHEPVAWESGPLRDDGPSKSVHDEGP